MRSNFCAPRRWRQGRASHARCPRNSSETMASNTIAAPVAPRELQAMLRQLHSLAGGSKTWQGGSSGAQSSDGAGAPRSHWKARGRAGAPPSHTVAPGRRSRQRSTSWPDTTLPRLDRSSPPPADAETRHEVFGSHAEAMSSARLRRSLQIKGAPHVVAPPSSARRADVTTELAWAFPRPAVVPPQCAVPARKAPPKVCPVRTGVVVKTSLPPAEPAATRVTTPVVGKYLLLTHPSLSPPHPPVDPFQPHRPT